MQIEVWKTLLRRVPAEQIDNLMLMTAQGTELNVQALLRMEEDYMVLRGRLAGTNDDGRIFVIPYVHLDHLGFQRPLSDAQFQAVFAGVPMAAPPPVAAAVAAPAPPPAPAQLVAAVPVAPAPAERDLLARVPRKSEIIRRLRLRSATQQGESPAKE